VVGSLLQAPGVLAQRATELSQTLLPVLDCVPLLPALRVALAHCGVVLGLLVEREFLDGVDVLPLLEYSLFEGGDLGLDVHQLDSGLAHLLGRGLQLGLELCHFLAGKVVTLLGRRKA